MTTVDHSPLLGPAADPAAGAPELFFADAVGALTGRVDATWRSARSDDTGWVADVVGSLAEGDRAICAFSFEDDQPAVAHRIGDLQQLAGGIRTLGDRLGASTTEPVARHHRVTEHPAPAQYAAAVSDALRRIEMGGLDKVVLGRGLEVLSDPPLRATDLLHQLAGGRDGAPAGRYLYAVPVAEDRVLLGASPELLVRRRGHLVEAMPLAGSLPRSVIADRERACQELLASTKDRAEHAHVVDDLVARLREVCQDVQAAPPEVIGTDSMWHLGTRITATLATGSLDDPSCSALALARVVHPTPAVGGVPVADARSTIAELETAPRGWFAGAVGWVDAHGDGEFALTLRSGVLSGASLRVWAGAGIVAGSDPQLEVRETGAKLTTMTKAAGL